MDAPPPSTQADDAEHLALIRRFDELKAELDRPRTPAREVINHTRLPHTSRWLEQLRTQDHPPAGAMRYCRQHIKLLERTAKLPPPRPLEARRTDEAIGIDGRLDEKAWSRAEPIEIRYEGLDAIEGPVAQARLLWDDKHLYAGFTVPDDDIVAPVLDRDEPVFRNDCVEIFLCPKPTETGRYWELNISPSGSLLDALARKSDEAWGGEMNMDADMRDLQHASMCYPKGRGMLNGDAGYTIEVAIPLADLPDLSQPTAAGHALYILLAQANKSSSQNSDALPRYIAHTPMPGWFHNIWAYSKLVFVDE